MRHHLVNLARNLAAGLRLALFLPVSRFAFRIDLVQLLLLLAVSAVLDAGVDWVRFGADGYFSWLGLGNEIFGAGVLLLTAAVLALAFGQPPLALAVPVLVLAGFPLLQFARAAASITYDLMPDAAFAWAVVDLLVVAWVYVLAVRSVALALAPAAGRWRRALAGGLMLITPIWLAPLIAPGDSWWKDPSIQGGPDPRYPNPASEPVLAAQRQLLDEALAGLEGERPNATDLYFVGFAGDARDDVFRKDVLAAQSVMDERWDTAGRSLALVNSQRTLLDVPAATVTNLREALSEIGAAIDAERDVVMVYLASHGSPEHVLDVALPPLELVPITASVLKGLLDEAGIKWRIVVVSACYSGNFVDTLQDDYTIVLTASATDRASFGCGHRSDATYFGEALFQRGLAQADSFLAGAEAARERVAEREKTAGLGPPSNPQVFIGPAMSAKIKELDRGNTARRSGRSV